MFDTPPSPEQEPLELKIIDITVDNVDADYVKVNSITLAKMSLSDLLYGKDHTQEIPDNIADRIACLLGLKIQGYETLCNEASIVVKIKGRNQNFVAQYSRDNGWHGKWQ